MQMVERCGADFKPDDEQAGGASQPWLAYVSRGSDWRSLPAEKCRRTELFNYVRKGVPIDLACAAVLAWGGMHRLHGRRLFATTEWLRIAERMRVGELNRKEAYNQFADLRQDGGAPGMGPAYFTKLIFFLTPHTNGEFAPGYIMDQWTACSVNLLLGDPQAVLTNCSYSWNRRGKLDSHYTVSDYNDGERYERFCSTVEALADRLNLAPIETELLLLSEGGKQPLAWRSYVKQHRRPAFA